eukprot:2177763-Alexandrium_andersonii.AAC.1
MCIRDRLQAFKHGLASSSFRAVAVRAWLQAFKQLQAFKRGLAVASKPELRRAAQLLRASPSTRNSEEG